MDPRFRVNRQPAGRFVILIWFAAALERVGAELNVSFAGFCNSHGDDVRDITRHVDPEDARPRRQSDPVSRGGDDADVLGADMRWNTLDYWVFRSPRKGEHRFHCHSSPPFQASILISLSTVTP